MFRRLWRRSRMPFLTLVALAAVALVSGSLVHAAPAFGAPALATKVILADTSIDGPALLTTYSPKTVIAWTGADTYHHLNLMTSSDGLRYTNKLTLPETSLWRPALAFIDSGRGDPYGTILIAWTGTDKSHTLNLEFIRMPDLTMTQKITFWGETSFTAPALTTINGDVNSDIYLAWAGTDGAGTLNVIHRTTMPSAQTKVTLHGKTSVSRPSLATDHDATNGQGLLLAWTGSDNRLRFATSSDGATFTEAAASPLSAKSVWAPSMVGFYTTTAPSHWLAWTGTGAQGTYNITVMYTQHFPAWSDTGASTTLGELALSSPALAYNANGSAGGVLLGWTGTDIHHHLNVALLTPGA